MENMADRTEHGRTVHGECSLNSKLTEAQATEVYQRAHLGEIQHVIAGDFGISRPLVSAIKLGRAWARVTGAAA